MVNQLICQTEKGDAKKIGLTLAAKYDKYYQKKGNVSDIDYGLLAYKAPFAVFTHEAKKTDSLVTETGIGDILAFKDIKECALKMGNIKIKGEYLSVVPVEETSCCFQVNKMDIYCLQEKHCLGTSLQMTRYIKVQCIMAQFKEQKIDGDQAKKMFKAMDYDVTAKMMERDQKDKGVKGLLLEKVVAKKIDMNKVKGQKEADRWLLIYKDKAYLLEKQPGGDLESISDEDTAQSEVALQLILLKKSIKSTLELVQMNSVCEGVCLLGEFLQQEKRLTDDQERQA